MLRSGGDDEVEPKTWTMSGLRKAGSPQTYSCGGRRDKEDVVTAR